MLDEIDRQLIILLQENAQLTNAALAEQVGLTVSSVHERVKKLEQKGIITGYVATVSAEALGKPITAFLRLRTSDAPDGYAAAKHSVLVLSQQEAEILECHHIAGEDCFILKVRTASPGRLEKLIERIRTEANVSQTVTNIVLSTVKESTRVIPE